MAFPTRNGHSSSTLKDSRPFIALLLGCQSRFGVKETTRTLTILRTILANDLLLYFTNLPYTSTIPLLVAFRNRNDTGLGSAVTRQLSRFSYHGPANPINESPNDDTESTSDLTLTNVNVGDGTFDFEQFLKNLVRKYVP